jgi:hypothetical protein
MEERNDDIAQTARDAVEARCFSDLRLEALRVQRDAYVASGGEAAVIYDKLRDELVAAKQRLSDQEISRRWDPIFQSGMSRPASSGDDAIVFPQDLSETAVNNQKLVAEKADLSVEAADLSRPASNHDTVVLPEDLSRPR